MRQSTANCAMMIVMALATRASFAQAAEAEGPAPLPPLPSSQQVAWADLETCAFVHFGPNTFSDREWGEGREDPAIFNPTQLDCRQWARVCRDAGLKAIIITAKHHDGFCLWPSKLTGHCVKNSPWRGGQGDVLRELSDACREFGLKFGVYLSPWDRNNPLYGSGQPYNEYFASQLREVLSDYGKVFEVWFDGACGEGPNGKRQAYDWPLFIRTVRECQPSAVIFSDAGPDVRWVGNERGYAGETNWSLLKRDAFYPGIPGKEKELNEGDIDGTHWLPAECDVSIRPGWFYHAAEDHQVKSVAQLADIYLGSVGRNGNLLLNLPVDRRGLVHENDAARLREWRAALDAMFADDLLLRAGARLAQAGAETWTIALEEPRDCNMIVLGEPIERGQRIKSFVLEVEDSGRPGSPGSRWREIARGTTVGHKRIVRFDSVKTASLRIRVLETRGSGPPLLSRVGLFHAQRPVEAAIEVPAR